MSWGRNRIHEAKYKMAYELGRKFFRYTQNGKAFIRVKSSLFFMYDINNQVRQSIEREFSSGYFNEARNQSVDIDYDSNVILISTGRPDNMSKSVIYAVSSSFVSCDVYRSILDMAYSCLQCDVLEYGTRHFES